MGAADVSQAARWPGSGAHTLPLAWEKLPLGCSAASSELDPSDGRADSRSSWSRRKGSPDGLFLLKCCRIPYSSFPHPKKAGNPGNLLRTWKDRRDRDCPAPRGSRGPPDCHRPAHRSPLPTEEGAHLKARSPTLGHEKGSPVHG